MGSISRFEDIDAWKKSRKLTREIYEVTSEGDFSKDFGLRNQIERASVSIMSNIAEGFERGGNKEFVQFLFQAKASCAEVKSQLYVAKDTNYISDKSFKHLYELASEVSKLISGFISYLRKSSEEDFRDRKSD